MRVPVDGLLDAAYVASRAALIGEKAGPPPAAGVPPGLTVLLVIGFTAVAGLAVTPGPSLPGWQILALALAVTLASAAAGAFNQYVERDLDARPRGLGLDALLQRAQPLGLDRDQHEVAHRLRDQPRKPFTRCELSQ